MKIITEEMRFRKRLCEFALKYGVTKAARRYHTNRQFVYRQLEKYDGTLKSLALKSRRPHSHPNAHTEEEIALIKQVYARYGCNGFAEVYVQLVKRGYKRSYGSMLNQIKKLPKDKVKIRKGYTRHEEIRGQYPGDKVQVDIKYVPKECLLFDTIDKKYYQITAIDEFSRKRILEVVDEKSVTNTSRFVRTLEDKMGLKINTIQTDNGPEFVNNQLEYDNVDDEFIKSPKKWNTNGISKYMIVMGITSSIIDVIAFIIFWYVLGYNSIEKASYFQTAWFITSLITELMIIYNVRTSKHIYEKSNISPVLAGLTIFSGILTIITPLVIHKITNFHFEILPFNFYIYLILLLVLYFTIVSIVKRIYIKKNHEWL